MEIPLERMLIETDAPFLAPQPMRGKRNEPMFVKFTAEEIARLRKTDMEEIGRTTSSNAKELFTLK
jgi:TatD DNase family protein